MASDSGSTKSSSTSTGTLPCGLRARNSGSVARPWPDRRGRTRRPRPASARATRSFRVLIDSRLTWPYSFSVGPRKSLQQPGQGPEFVGAGPREGIEDHRLGGGDHGAGALAQLAGRCAGWPGARESTASAGTCTAGPQRQQSAHGLVDADVRLHPHHDPLVAPGQPARSTWRKAALSVQANAIFSNRSTVRPGSAAPQRGGQAGTVGPRPRGYCSLTTTGQLQPPGQLEQQHGCCAGRRRTLARSHRGGQALLEVDQQQGRRGWLSSREAALRRRQWRIAHACEPEAFSPCRAGASQALSDLSLASGRRRSGHPVQDRLVGGGIVGAGGRLVGIEGCGSRRSRSAPARRTRTAGRLRRRGSGRPASTRPNSMRVPVQPLEPVQGRRRRRRGRRPGRTAGSAPPAPDRTGCRRGRPARAPRPARACTAAGWRGGCTGWTGTCPAPRLARKTRDETSPATGTIWKPVRGLQRGVHVGHLRDALWIQRQAVAASRYVAAGVAFVQRGQLLPDRPPDRVLGLGVFDARARAVRPA